jgi:hypothetical protein
MPRETVDHEALCCFVAIESVFFFLPYVCHSHRLGGESENGASLFPRGSGEGHGGRRSAWRLLVTIGVMTPTRVCAWARRGACTRIVWP